MDNTCIYHDSHDTFYRNPFGSIACGESIRIRLKIRGCKDIGRAALRVWIEGQGEEIIEMNPSDTSEDINIYQCTLLSPDNPGLLWYYFVIESDGKKYYYGNNYEMLGGIGCVYDSEPRSYQITVYKKDFKTPDWFKGCVMYQIFVDRFFNGNDYGGIQIKDREYRVHKNWDEQPEYLPNSNTGEFLCNDFYGGNLKGIIKKLWYLKELGIDVIYLNPVFDSSSNHKYDTGNYMKIDSMFGGNDTFKELCELAYKLNIRIILDGVFSHTGSDSVYFNKEGKYDSIGAYQSMCSPYYPWYRFIKFPDEYECWWGFHTLPNVNELEPSYMDFILKGENSVIRYWMRMGAAGWRLDVADELPDEFIKELRCTVKSENDDGVIIGEVWDDASNKVSYGMLRQYLMGSELDTVMNYPLRNMLLNFLLEKWDADQLNRAIMNQFENYPAQVLYSLVNLAGSHDTPRIKTLLGEGMKESSVAREEMAKIILNSEQSSLANNRIMLYSLFQISYPGVPCVYYGDEVGLEGGGDPFNRGTHPWEKGDMDLLEWYRRIIKLRHKLDVLKTGYFKPVFCDNDVYGFIRYIVNGKDTFYQERQNGIAVILFNRSKCNTHKVKIDLRYWNIKELLDLLNNEKVYLSDGFLSQDIIPLEGKLLFADL